MTGPVKPPWEPKLASNLVARLFRPEVRPDYAIQQKHRKVVQGERRKRVHTAVRRVLEGERGGGQRPHLRSRSAMLVTLSWKYCTISENKKLKALRLTCSAHTYIRHISAMSVSFLGGRTAVVPEYDTAYGLLLARGGGGATTARPIDSMPCLPWGWVSQRRPAGFLRRRTPHDHVRSTTAVVLSVFCRLQLCKKCTRATNASIRFAGENQSVGQGDCVNRLRHPALSRV